MFERKLDQKMKAVRPLVHTGFFGHLYISPSSKDALKIISKE